MDWITALGFGIAIEERKRKKEKGKRTERIANHRSALSDGIYELETVLCDLVYSCTLSIEQSNLDELQELAPLFPMEEILSSQGYIGAEQEAYLRDYFTIRKSRYNIGQFKKLAIARTDSYTDWNSLAGLDRTFCGRIWHTLIELICRQRAPELLQQIIDAVGTILYHFWFLENTETISVQIRYQRIISALNFHAEEDQKTAYLHAVMLLQVKLAERYGGSATDFEPCLDLEEADTIDGKANLRFSVFGKDHFTRFYAVREIRSPGEPNLIWEIPAGGAATEIFFAE